MASYSLLEWDTKFFGYKIAKILVSQDSKAQIDQTISVLKLEDYKLAYFFVSPEDDTSNDSILACTGQLVDEKVTYSYSIDEQTIFKVDDYIVIYSEDIVTQELTQLTLQSGTYSRFRIDPNFRNSEYESLYKEWIKKSVTKDVADQVLVYKEEDHILGFITMKIAEGHGSIGLLAVDENFRGKSIGKKLLTSSFAYFQNNNITTIEVVTQRVNQIACRFYEACGFKISEIVNVYHLWIK
jgi:dTDP-4-amino-4,6-dideoxy-D-galactose acyltransferase